MNSGKRTVLILAVLFLLCADAALAENEEAIIPLTKSRTSILIAHRLSTILSADEILVVQDGRIVERGRHQDLVKAGGVYTELYETQFKIQEADES